MPSIWQNKRTFDADARRRELLKRLNRIPGITLPAKSIARRPSVPLTVFRDEVVLRQFLAVLGWVVEEIRGWEFGGEV